VTKEDIKKRFEFDLNVGVFKSFSHYDNQLIAFRFDTCFDKYSIVDLLDDLDFKCVTNRIAYACKLSSVDIPAPEGPKITTNSPILIFKSIPSSALNFCSPTT